MSQTPAPTSRNRKPRQRVYGTRIRQARERKGFTQDYMANLLNITQNSYWKIENDETRVPAETLEEIAKILEMDAAELLQEDYSKYRIKQTNRDQASGFVIHEASFEAERKVWQELDHSRKGEIAAKDEVIEAKNETAVALNKLNEAQQETIQALRLALKKEVNSE